jgi:hypothetical protein
MQNNPKFVKPWLWTTPFKQICNFILPILIIVQTIKLGSSRTNFFDDDIIYGIALAILYILEFSVTIYFYIVVHSYHERLCDPELNGVNMPGVVIRDPSKQERPGGYLRLFGRILINLLGINGTI